MHSVIRRHLVVAGLLVAAASRTGAQGSIPADDPGIKKAFDAIKGWNAWIIENQRQLCEIPAPPFKEQARGAEFRKRIAALGYPLVNLAIGFVLLLALHLVLGGRIGIAMASQIADQSIG